MMSWKWSGLAAALMCCPTMVAAQTVMDSSTAEAPGFNPATLGVFLRYEVPDPYSTQIVALRKVGGNAFCGELNTKDQNGAYTGFRVFWADLANGEVVIDRPGLALDKAPHDPRLVKACKAP